MKRKLASMKLVVSAFVLGFALLTVGTNVVAATDATLAGLLIMLAGLLLIQLAFLRISHKIIRNQSRILRKLGALEALGAHGGVVPASRQPRTLTTLTVPATRIDDEAHRGTPLDRAPKSLRDFTIAAILDEFSFDSFYPEADVIPLEPGTWRHIFETRKPDFFLCESAWSGHDSQRRPWQGKIYGSVAFDRENRTELLAILNYCQEHGIPTVFWNKEDPVHFEDRRHDFVSTAVKFDHVLTTAIECVPRYQKEYGHTSVHCLPFAVQPRLFNPREVGERSDDVIFAGGWYANHAERVRDMTTMFDTVLASGRDLVIYDRFSGSDDPTHRFPDSYADYIRPAVPYSETANLFKQSVIGMTINTETRSRSMFARRIFELMASNTLVVSNYSAGVEEFFGDDVVYLNKEPGRLEALTTQNIERMRERGVAAVLSRHTYRHRLETIVQVAGLQLAPRAEDVALLIRLRDAARAQDAVDVLRQGGHRAVLLIASQVSELDTAELFERLHGPTLNVVSERLYLEGALSQEELLGEQLDVVLIDGVPRGGALDVDELRLHVDYAGQPVVHADERSRRYTTRAYEQGEAMLLAHGGLRGVLSVLEQEEKLPVYQV